MVAAYQECSPRCPPLNPPQRPIRWTATTGRALLTEVEATVAAVIADLEPDLDEARRPGPGRPRILPALAAVERGAGLRAARGASQRAVWRLLTRAAGSGTSRASPSPTRRSTSAWPPTAPARWSALRRRQPPAGRPPRPVRRPDPGPFATEVVALDETTLDPVARTLPALRAVPRGDDRLLPGKLAGLFDLRRQLLRRVALPARPPPEREGRRPRAAGRPARPGA